MRIRDLGAKWASDIAWAAAILGSLRGKGRARRTDLFPGGPQGAVRPDQPLMLCSQAADDAHERGRAPGPGSCGQQRLRAHSCESRRIPHTPSRLKTGGCGLANSH